MAEGISSGRDHARSLALNVADDQLPEVRGTAAAFVLGLRVEVLDQLSAELQGQAFLAFSGRPTGHVQKVWFSHYTGGVTEPPEHRQRH